MEAANQAIEPRSFILFLSRLEFRRFTFFRQIGGISNSHRHSGTSQFSCADADKLFAGASALQFGNIVPVGFNQLFVDVSSRVADVRVQMKESKEQSIEFGLFENRGKGGKSVVWDGNE